MKKLFFLISTFLIISIILTTQAAASSLTGGSIGIPIWFDSLDELLQYIENEQWRSEWWYDSTEYSTKVDYLKRMSNELFLPVGYTKDDILNIKIDDVMVIVYLSDGKGLHYWFTENVSFEMPTEICAPTEFRLLPGTNDVWDIPVVYNIFEQGENETVIPPTEAGRNDFDDETV